VAQLKKFNLKGEEVGSLEIEDAFLEVDANSQMIKDYIVALRRNSRQWSANTKGRSEVVHTTKKPHPQKGTGNARQGSLVSPQFRGGGIVFGPKPKFDQHIRINRKERRLAVRHLLAEKIKEGRLSIIEDGALTQTFTRPKTKMVFSFMEKRGFTGRRLLFVGEGAYESTENNASPRSIFSEKYDVFKMSIRNIQKTNFVLASNLSGYDVIVAHRMVVTESAFVELKKLLS